MKVYLSFCDATGHHDLTFDCLSMSIYSDILHLFDQESEFFCCPVVSIDFLSIDSICFERN